MRGLKLLGSIPNCCAIPVALYTSAWIEIPSAAHPRGSLRVALYTSAWIEMIIMQTKIMTFFVALYTSAWIEIIQDVVVDIKYKCRTLHECVD